MQTSGLRVAAARTDLLAPVEATAGDSGPEDRRACAERCRQIHIRSMSIGWKTNASLIKCNLMPQSRRLSASYDQLVDALDAVGDGLTVGRVVAWRSEPAAELP